MSDRPEVIVRAYGVAARAPLNRPPEGRIQEMPRLQELRDDREHGPMAARSGRGVLDADQRHRTQNQYGKESRQRRPAGWHDGDERGGDRSPKQNRWQPVEDG